MTHPTVHEAVALKRLSPNTFQSDRAIEGKGGGGRLGFGGWTMGFGINVAWNSLSPSQHHLRLYSCLGTFLGPANIKHKLIGTVTTLRDTRTFATRHVTLSQQQDDGQTRTVMSLTCDFMKPEPASFLRYSVAPLLKYTGPDGSFSLDESEQQARDQGVAEDYIQAWREFYSHFHTKFEQRSAPEGWYGQSARSLLPLSTRVPMDDVGPTRKTQAEWYRSRVALDGYIQHLLTVPYILDNNIIADVADWSRLDWHQDAAAVSSLDFALRLFTNELDLNRWTLRENKSPVAGIGRAFSEACIFDEQGNMLAMLSEQCILRPKKDKARI